jgi:hypothetical protein
MKLIMSFGEIRKMSDKTYLEFLKAGAAKNWSKQSEIYNKSKIVGILHKNITDLDSDDFKEELVYLETK